MTIEKLAFHSALISLYTRNVNFDDCPECACDVIVALTDLGIALNKHFEKKDQGKFIYLTLSLSPERINPA